MGTGLGQQTSQGMQLVTICENEFFFARSAAGLSLGGGTGLNLGGGLGGGITGLGGTNRGLLGGLNLAGAQKCMQLCL